MEQKPINPFLSRLFQRAANYFQRQANHYAADAAGQPLSDERPTTDVVEQLLHELGCTYSTSTSDDHQIFYLFDYQGGHFQLRVPSRTLPVVTLDFPYFFSAPIDNINALRITCNRFNSQPILPRFTYAFNEKDNEFDAHMTTSFTLYPNSPDSILFFKAVLNTQFAFRRDFESIYEDINKSFGNASDTDRDLACRERIDFLIREQEMSHQSELFQIRSTVGDPLTLDNFVEFCFGMKNLNYVYVKIVRDEQVRLEFDVETIRSIDIKAEYADISYFIYFTDPLTPADTLRQMQLQVTPEYEDSNTFYLRISAILFPATLHRDADRIVGQQYLSDLTFLIAIDKYDDICQRREYEFVWDDALDKIQHEKEDQLTPEQQVLVQADSPDVGYYLYRGQRLFAKGCFYDAIDHLTIPYHYLNDSYSQLSSTQRQAFDEICYYIGISYSELNLYADAFYFLSHLVSRNNTRYTQAYIDCLVNAHDSRAQDEIERHLGYIDYTRQQAEIDDETLDPALDDFEQYLRRRQVYVYINNERFDKAESILREMLKQPANSDFAIGELAYIQKIREARDMDSTEPFDSLPF